MWLGKSRMAHTGRHAKRVRCDLLSRVELRDARKSWCFAKRQRSTRSDEIAKSAYFMRWRERLAFVFVCIFGVVLPHHHNHHHHNSQRQTGRGRFVFGKMCQQRYLRQRIWNNLHNRIETRTLVLLHLFVILNISTLYTYWMWCAVAWPFSLMWTFHP